MTASRRRDSRRRWRPKSSSATSRATSRSRRRFGEPGAYRAVFFPTAAGAYTFHIFGEIDGEPIDERFTSGPDTFSEVQDATAGQFPVVLPAAGDTARDAEAGAAAAGTATLALVVGGAGLLAGLMALGLAVARRRA